MQAKPPRRIKACANVWKSRATACPCVQQFVPVLLQCNPVLKNSASVSAGLFSKMSGEYANMYDFGKNTVISCLCSADIQEQQ
jgi:hypothetical protein